MTGERCPACGHVHDVEVLDPSQLDVPWTQVGREVIDRDADVVATFVNGHDAYHAVLAVNCVYFEKVAERVRALHWPSPTRDPACDCYDGLDVCPTIAALDGAGR